MQAAPRLLLALQYWTGDIAPAMRLARLIADLEPAMCEHADFLFVARFDCEHDAASIDYVSRKFRVHRWISKRKEIGWPAGCNGLWLDTYNWAYRMMEANKIPQYKGIFTFEGDGAPTRPGWIPMLGNLWDCERQARGGKLSVMGDLLPTGPQGEHINGNLVATCDIPMMRQILRVLDGTQANMGWDYINAPLFKSMGWCGTKAIRSLYNMREEMTQERLNGLRDEGVLYIHGVKNFSLQDLVRKEFIPR